MSSVFDVTGVTINDGELTASTGPVQTVTATVQDSVSTVTITTEAAPEIVEIQVPGVQGAPGANNLRIQATDPSASENWGINEKDYIWVQTG